jgi:hypothetical protein
VVLIVAVVHVEQSYMLDIQHHNLIDHQMALMDVAVVNISHGYALRLVTVHHDMFVDYG